MAPWRQAVRLDPLLLVSAENLPAGLVAVATGACRSRVRSRSNSANADIGQTEKFIRLQDGDQFPFDAS
jgi:hypothetical protein